MSGIRKNHTILIQYGIHIWFPLFNDIEVTGGPIL